MPGGVIRNSTFLYVLFQDFALTGYSDGYGLPHCQHRNAIQNLYTIHASCPSVAYIEGTGNKSTPR